MSTAERPIHETSTAFFGADARRIMKRHLEARDTLVAVIFALFFAYTEWEQKSADNGNDEKEASCDRH